MKQTDETPSYLMDVSAYLKNGVLFRQI